MSGSASAREPARQAPTNSSFFETNAEAFDPLSPGLRRCQQGAYWATWAHFTSSSAPALISLPTGAGKTALMMALAFGLRARRVLVVTPAAVLVTQTAAKFESLDDLRNAGALSTLPQTPFVLPNRSVLTTASEWQTLTRYDVVVATPKTTSPEEPGVAPAPADMFDLVFIDEAHHAPAKTWSGLLRHFRDARRVLLTATPFRRDRIRIPAQLVYHYPIGRALDDGIYRPVEYVPAKPGTGESDDEAVCREAAKVMARERPSKARILVRTDRVSAAQQLEAMYNAQGIKVATVDYTSTKSENDEVIAKVKNGDLDGMVCVGMLGEGLDIPQLKVAALHSPPKSLPFTLQFIGRVARTGHGQQGNAVLLSVPALVTGEMRNLHRTDADWERLIPELAEEAISKAHAGMSTTGRAQDFLIDPRTLTAYFSVRVYDAPSLTLRDCPTSIDDDDTSTIVFQQHSPTGVLAIITQTVSPPQWAIHSDIAESRYELHVFIHDAAHKLLFELTTRPVLMKAIRKAVVEGDVKPFAADRIFQAIEANPSTYFVVGLRNGVRAGGAQPAYKMMMGSDAQASVRPDDGMVFTPGHVFVRLAEPPTGGASEVRGVAAKRSRIWSARRGSVDELHAWTLSISNAIKRKKTAALPKLDFLMREEPLTAPLSELPIGVFLDPHILLVERRYLVASNGAEEAEEVGSSDVPHIDIQGLLSDGLACSFWYHPDHEPVQLLYQPTRKTLWTVRQGHDIRLVFRGTSPSDGFSGTVCEYLSDYPPSFVMPSGGAIRGCVIARPSAPLSSIPTHAWIGRSWARCNIQNETIVTGRVPWSILEFVEREIAAATPNDALVIRDHGAGEIADIIAVEPTSKRVTFYHCKKSSGVKPGTRVNDCQEVIAQAIRTVSWVRNENLFTALAKHVNERPNSKVVKGTVQDLRAAVKTFSANEWKFVVVAVQPGLSRTRGSSAAKISALFVAAYQLLRNQDAELEIWCSSP